METRRIIRVDSMRSETPFHSNGDLPRELEAIPAETTRPAQAKKIVLHTVGT